MTPKLPGSASPHRLLAPQCRVTCDRCRNFVAALDHAFPPAFRALAETLGLDLTKPAELCHWCHEEATGFHLTGGWFHFAGSIRSGRDAFQKSGVALEPLGAGFEVGFTSELQLLPERFRLQPACGVSRLSLQDGYTTMKITRRDLDALDTVLRPSRRRLALLLRKRLRPQDFPTAQEWLPHVRTVNADLNRVKRLINRACRELGGRG